LDGLVHVLIRLDLRPVKLDQRSPLSIRVVLSLSVGPSDEISDAHTLRVPPDGRVFIVIRKSHFKLDPTLLPDKLWS
jgi:hypothetical protein